RVCLVMRTTNERKRMKKAGRRSANDREVGQAKNYGRRVDFQVPD
ncbi:MAG: hypothetical protein ACI9M6_001653, partial [Hydrogenophaga sp.]